ncbi:MAG: KH domain-containing protein [Candidatus Melainabacteria bacterium]|nr:KH domain-containing protein [Candidatus Melainabacteria bacterium]
MLTVLSRESETVQINRESLNPGYSRIVVTSDPAITGRLIGKGGKTISALRELVRTVAREHGKRVDIEVC